jgi:hypothetical protein
MACLTTDETTSSRGAEGITDSRVTASGCCDSTVTYFGSSTTGWLLNKLGIGRLLPNNPLPKIELKPFSKTGASSF